MMTTHKPESRYFYGIDLIRFLAAFSVAAFHFSWHNNDIQWLMPFGWVGVQVFFVISGLVIANSAVNETPRRFAMGRFFRLYPGAWCAIAITAIFFLLVPEENYLQVGMVFHHSGGAFARSLVLLGNNNFIVGAYWTLPIEITFYCLIFILSSLRLLQFIQSFAVGLICWSGAYLTALTLSAAGIIHHVVHDVGYGSRACTLLRHGIYFGMGILLWLYKEKRLTWPGWTAMSVALVLAFFEIGNRAFEIAPILWSYGGNLRNSSLALESYAAFLIAFCAMVLSVRFNAGHVFTEGIYKVVRKLGLTTYPFYLLHEVVGGVVMYQVHKWGYSYLAGALAALLVVGVVSSLVALYCEPRLRNFIKRLLAGLNVAVS